MVKLVTDRFDKVLAARTVQELEHELYELGFNLIINSAKPKGPFIHFESINQDLGRLGHKRVSFMCYRPTGGGGITVQSYVKLSPYRKEKLFETFRVAGELEDFGKPILADANA